MTPASLTPPDTEGARFDEVPHVVSPHELALIKAGQIALGTIAIAAVAIIVLSFLVWVDFGVAEMKGPDADALTTVSDGYVVALMAALVVLAAAGILWRPRWTLALLPTLGALGIAICVVSGYTVATSWSAAGADTDGAFLVSGDPTAVPYVIAALGLGISATAAMLAALRASKTGA